jgi:DNA-directed RNA polymerase specialized sigma24 family protein
MESEDRGSITRWIGELQAGADSAAQGLWERYFQALVHLARARLRAAPRAAADEEDVALSAFDSFCAGAARGRFPRLADRDDLWRVLVTITARKAADLAKHERRQKRGGGRVRDEAGFAGGTHPGGVGGLDQVAGGEPTPEFAASVAEECRRLLDALGDEALRRIALRRMEGYTAEEIAAQLDCSVRTVTNKLKLVRLKWEARS